MLPAYATHFRIEPLAEGTESAAADTVSKALVDWISTYYRRGREAPPDVHDVDEIVWAPDRPLQVRIDTLPTGEFHKALSWSHEANGDTFYWTTRCDLAFAGGRLDFQFQLGYDTPAPGWRLDRPAPGRPRIIPLLIEHPAWRCTSGGQVLTIFPREVAGPEIEELCDTVLFSDDRPWPVVVVTPRDSSRRSYPVDATFVAERLAGTARVIQLRDPLTTRVLDRYLGPALAVGNFSIRVFSTSLEPGDSGADHWLFRGIKIKEAYPDDAAFANELFAQLAKRALTSFQEAPALAEFRRAAARRRLESERELSALRDRSSSDRELSDQLLKAVDQENRELRAENIGLREQVDSFKGQIESLRGELQAAQRNIVELSRHLGRGVVANAETSQQEELPRSVAEIVESAAAKLEFLEVLGSALDAAEDVPETFKFAPRVQAALEALNEGAEQRAQVGRMAGGWKPFFSNRGFDYKGLSDTSKIQFGDEYRFLYGERRELFEEHFTIGTRSANTCLSIHFSTRLRTDKIVVAYVGRHLRNTQS